MKRPDDDFYTKGEVLDQEMKAMQEFAIERMRDAPTLRDQFAMAALTGLLAHNATWLAAGESIHRQRPEVFVAQTAYDFADAMLKARDAKP